MKYNVPWSTPDAMFPCASFILFGILVNIILLSRYTRKRVIPFWSQEIDVHH